MIKFFRHIRKSLLMKNNTSKYFKYAIGEIVLVVIGILIALSINNWNQNRLDKIKSKEYHQRIVEDLDQFNTILSGEAMRSSKVGKYLTAAMQILKSKELTKKNKDTLDYALNNYFQMVQLQGSLDTYDELKSSGQLGLIYNKDLRKKLNRYIEFLSVVSKIFNQLSTQVNKTEPIDRHVTLILADKNSLDKIPLEYDFNLMKKDQFLINTLSRFALHWETKASFSNDLLKSGESLKKNILKELNND